MKLWDEVKQRLWAWGFIWGFMLTNAGYGIGWLIVLWLNHMGV